MEDHIVPLCS